jgi:capsular polysaccharide transport system permease protein
MNAPLDKNALGQAELQMAPAPAPAPAPKTKPRRSLVQALKRRRLTGAALAAGLVAVLYWSCIASDRYVSQADVIIQRTDLAAGKSMDFGSLLSGVGGNRTDELLLRDYLLSLDMLKKLDAKLHLREHYSDHKHDVLSRMWSKGEADELFHQYYLSRVNVELDEYSGVLVIKAQAYDAKTAQAITTMLMQEGERAMNDMGHQLAQDQVDFVEKQVAQMAERFQKTRQAVLRFQNQKGMVAPQNTAEHMVGVVDLLRAQRTELQTKRTALLGYLEPRAASVVELDTQIAAIDKQITEEQSHLTSPNGKALNSTVEEYQRLEMEAGFANDVYKTSLVALEKGRVEATRNLKKVSVVQSPTLPTFALEPRRIYNTIVSILVTLLVTGILHLLAAIIRDHKD